MPSVSLLPEGSGPGVTGELVALRVLDSSGETVHEQGVRVNWWTTLELEPGGYFARVTFPSGHTSQSKFTVKPEAGESERVVIRAPQSLHEWAGTPTDRGEFPPGAQIRQGRERHSLRSRRPDIWMRMWQRKPTPPPGEPFSAKANFAALVARMGEIRRQREGEEERFRLPGSQLPIPPKWRRLEPKPSFHLSQSFQVGPWPDSEAFYDQGIWAFASSPEGQVQNVAQLGGRDAPWRMVVLPPSGVELFVSTSGEGSGGFRVALATNIREDPAESVLAFFANGALDSARLAGEALLRWNPALFRTSPVAVAVAGLYLLRIQDRNRLKEWPGDSAGDFWWMPDLHVIRGWTHLLRDPPDREEARASFLRGAAVGLPVFTQALRFLVDGLEILEEWEPRFETEEALRQVGATADAADWSQVFTTFFGASPFEPSATPPAGVPLDTNHLHFLPEGMAQGVQFPDLPKSVLSRPLIQVLPDPSGWSVELEGVAFAACRTKREALDRASVLARDEAPSRLVIHRRDGATQAIRGFDPGG